MMSDNAKVFQAASSVITKVIRANEVNEYLLNNQVQWNFIVEKAPWWGVFGNALWGVLKGA